MGPSLDRSCEMAQYVKQYIFNGENRQFYFIHGKNPWVSLIQWSDNWEPDNWEPDNWGPDNWGPDNWEPDNWGPDNWEPDNWGPDNWGPDKRGSAVHASIHMICHAAQAEQRRHIDVICYDQIVLWLLRISNVIHFPVERFPTSIVT